MPKSPKKPEWDPPVELSIEEDGSSIPAIRADEELFAARDANDQGNRSGGSKTTHLGSSPAASLAWLILMSELVRKI